MSANGKKNNPKSVLKENIYRWNHDNRHINNGENHKFGDRYNCIEGKSIFKSKMFTDICDHNPYNYIYSDPKICEGVTKRNIQLPNGKGCKYIGPFREKLIKKGHLLCYHYRIISEEHCLTKLKTNKWYRESSWMDPKKKKDDDGNTIDDLDNDNNQQGYSLTTMMNSDYPEKKDEMLKYKRINSKLKFIHITKNAGRYIEEISKLNLIEWGENDSLLKKQNWYRGFDTWHIPLYMFDTYPYEDNVKLFTIVRNPYTRILSECFCKFGSPENYNKINDVDCLNKHIEFNIKNINYNNTFHWAPQNIYTHNPAGEQKIDIIYKFENFAKDLTNFLYKEFDVNIKFYQTSESKKKFSIHDISDANIILINEIYHLDFIYFNYNKIIR